MQASRFPFFLNGAGLPFGAYLNWWTDAGPSRIDGVTFWQTVGINRRGLTILRQNLVDPEAQQLTELGYVFANYVSGEAK